MEILLNPDGTRNREFRPYISEEEQANSVYLYNPNSRGFHYGLYDSAQPSCGSWLDLYNQFPSHVPDAVIDYAGRQRMVQPWYKNGNRYESLLKNTIPT